MKSYFRKDVCIPRRENLAIGFLKQNFTICIGSSKIAVNWRWSYVSWWFGLVQFQGKRFGPQQNFKFPYYKPPPTKKLFYQFQDTRRLENQCIILVLANIGIVLQIPTPTPQTSDKCLIPGFKVKFFKSKLKLSTKAFGLFTCLNLWNATFQR